MKSSLTKNYVCLKPMEEYKDMPVDENSVQRRQRRSYKLPRSEPQLQNTQRLTFEFRNFLSLKRKTPSLAGSRTLRMNFVIQHSSFKKACHMKIQATASSLTYVNVMRGPKSLQHMVPELGEMWARLRDAKLFQNWTYVTVL